MTDSPTPPPKAPSETSGHPMPQVPQDVPKRAKTSTSWTRLTNRARTIGQIAVLFALLVAGGIAVGFFYATSRKTATSPSKSPAVTALSQDDLNKLSQVSGSLGSNGQVLNIGADALFRGKIDVSGDVSIGGRLSATGTTTLSALTINGATGATGLNVGSNLVVGGAATFQKTLTVTDLASVGNLSVSGSASVNSLNADTVAVHTIAISGPLTIGHLVTQGAAPAIAAGATGAGGTVSISGNDTAGTVNINTGAGPGNVLATVTFRAAFGATPHIELTALTDAAATAGAYVTRTAGGFQVHAHAAASGATLSFDYLVVQ